MIFISEGKKGLVGNYNIKWLPIPNFDRIYQAILEIILPTVDSRNAFGNCTESA